MSITKTIDNSKKLKTMDLVVFFILITFFEK